MAKIGYVVAYANDNPNFGTSLQGYALLKKMQELGHDVEIIHYTKNLSFFEKVNWIINSYRCGLGVNPFLKLFRHDYGESYNENIRVRFNAIEKYKDNKFHPYFKEYIGYDSLSKGSRNYNCVVVGSDQVWTPLSLPTKYYNLLFVSDDIRKVAYASSFGVQEIPDFQKKATGAYLDRFYKISVREQRAKEIVDSLSHQTAQVVADPTLLLTKEEWEEEIKDSKYQFKEPYLFSYLISENEEARKKVKELAKKKGLKIICIRHLEKYRAIDETYGDESPYDVDPNDFVSLIKNATYVCGDSFHCTVFSSLFHKNFLTFYRSSNGKNARNSRIDSLFNVLGINPQHIYNNGGLDGIDSLVEWDAVDNKISKLRQESLEFLKESLE